MQVSAGRQPNIILLLGDDHRADALGCAGNPYVKTPHLDTMAAQGVHFLNYFCTTPICCASRASIMTGKYAATHTINDFTKPLNAAQVERAYFGQLRHHGYHTGFIGKFGVGSSMPSAAFDVWYGFGGQGKYFPQGEAGPHLTDIMSDQSSAVMPAATWSRSSSCSGTPPFRPLSGILAPNRTSRRGE